MYFHTLSFQRFLLCPSSFPLFHLFPFLSSSSTHFPSPPHSLSLSVFHPSFPLSSDECKNRTGEALSPLPARRLISIFMRGSINYTWDPEGKQRQKNETWTHILTHTHTLDTHTHTHARAHTLYMQVCSRTHKTNMHIDTSSLSLPLTPSLNHTTQTERYRQVIGEKECVVQYIGSVQRRRHTQFYKGEVEVTLSETGNAAHTQSQCLGWLYFSSTIEGKRV